MFFSHFRVATNAEVVAAATNSVEAINNAATITPNIKAAVVDTNHDNLAKMADSPGDVNPVAVKAVVALDGNFLIHESLKQHIFCLKLKDVKKDCQIITS